ncbi:MAG: hypothetical protein QW568_01980 [Candidatus Anstonellaceae archaeon]
MIEIKHDEKAFTKKFSSRIELEDYLQKAYPAMYEKYKKNPDSVILGKAGPVSSSTASLKMTAVSFGGKGASIQIKGISMPNGILDAIKKIFKR